MRVGWRHPNLVLRGLDIVSTVLVVPGATAFSWLLAVYYSDTEERKDPRRKLLPWLVLGPLLLLLTVLLAPWLVSGSLLWILVCLLSPGQQHFTTISWERNDEAEEDVSELSVGSMNVLLCPEALCKWQNVSGVYRRMAGIAHQINNQEEKRLANYRADMSKEESVVERFPRMDIICFQEVHERVYGIALSYLLRHHYPHFILDISNNSWTHNRFCLGSGLMVASRYPVLAAEFTPFTHKKGWQRYVCYGILVCKLQLPGGGVAIVANLHNVAFQGKDDLLARALDETLAAVHVFKARHVADHEHVLTETIAGDFNLDNMSPSDVGYNKHQLFSIYRDDCMLRPGEDHRFSVGTEMRQLHILRPEVQSSALFRSILLDDIRRRFYVLDADVQEHTFDLFVIDPKVGSSGDVEATRWGGGRRIDRILVRHDLAATRGLAFSTSLTGMTDHIPYIVNMTLLGKTTNITSM